MTPAQLRGVNHVIMEEGSSVDELNDGRQADMMPAAVAEGMGAEQDQNGT